MIKKILICLVAIITFSCDVSDDAPSSQQELLPIETVSMVNEFVVGNTYEINMVYITPTNCHSFNNIYYVKNGNERTVAVISNVLNYNNCNSLNVESEASFDFLPTEIGSYVFKFWQGTDADGQDNYLIMEIPVIE